MNFFTILLSNDNDNTITQLVSEGKKEVDIFHLNQHSDVIDKDSVFFICIGGDKTKSESWWLKNGKDETTKGFKYIASLLQRPEQYDKNDSKNYKIRIKIEYTFIKPIKKEEFIYWPDSYDTDASVATKGKQTQAIGLLREEKKYLGLLRGALYYENRLKDFYSTFFGEAFLAKIEALLDDLWRNHCLLLKNRIWKKLILCLKVKIHPHTPQTSPKLSTTVYLAAENPT